MKRKKLPLYIRILALLQFSLGFFVILYFYFGWRIYNYAFLDVSFLYITIALFIAPLYYYYPASPRYKNSVPWWDILCAAIITGISLYFVFTGYTMLAQGWEFKPPTPALIAGAVLYVLFMEGLRRAMGWMLVAIFVPISLLPFLGSYLPGLLKGTNFSYTRIIGFHVFGPESFLGSPTRAVLTVAAGYYVFAATVTATGAGRVFMDLASLACGRLRGGVAKVSIAASALMGTCTGSVVANIATVGPFTIPEMKTAGYANDYAAGIVACASSGSQIMPPVLGATAFLIAANLGVSYGTVVVASVFPAIFYFLALFFQVDSYAARRGIKGCNTQLPSLKPTLIRGIPFFVSLLLLIVLLVYLNLASTAPFYATALMLILSAAINRTPIHKIFIGFLESAGMMVMDITVILVTVGAFVGGLYLSGLAQDISSIIISIAGNNFIPLLLLGMVASIFLGCGMPTLGIYALLVILLVPFLIRVGVPPMAAHFFVMYSGVLSFITPPVAVGAYVAAPIAGASVLKTCLSACRLGAVLFLLPLIVPLNPAWILVGNSWWEISVFLVSSGIGIAALVGAIEGYLIGVGRIRTVPRIIIAIAGVVMMYPNYWSILASLLVIALVVASKYTIFKERKTVAG